MDKQLEEEEEEMIDFSAKILAERLKRIIDKFASTQQTDFVPGREITDNPGICQLKQAYLCEKNDKRLMLFQVKEFDRVSHEYLMKALKSAGMGQHKMRLWMHIVHREADPMRHRVAVNGNGKLSRMFPFQAGLAKGCPFSQHLIVFAA